jgi:hypothetical protein
MNRVSGIYENGRVIIDSAADWPEGSRVEVSLVGSVPDIPIAGESGGIRPEFENALNDTTGVGLDESLWPETPQERKLWLNWFDTRGSLDLTPEEQTRMESFWQDSRAEQKELVRESWEVEGPSEE